MITHYYTKRGEPVKWSLPLLVEAEQEHDLKPCKQCGKLMERTAGSTTGQYEAKIFCNYKCQHLWRAEEFRVELSEEEIAAFKSWAMSQGYRVNPIPNSKSFKLRKDQRYRHITYKNGGYYFKDGSLALVGEWRAI